MVSFRRELCGEHLSCLNPQRIRPGCRTGYASRAADDHHEQFGGADKRHRGPRRDDCASTPARTALTCASTLAVHAATSSMLAHAAVSLLFSYTKQAARHGRPSITGM